MKNARPEVLIEKWLPIQQLGIESQRENSTGLHPPPNRLHVWWARRPLTVSRAAILASLLPPDVDDKWFLETLGIFGDPVEARRKIEEALRRSERIANPYEHPGAFTYIPSKDELGKILTRITAHWGSNEIHVLDSMVGGGSILFEARRYGFQIRRSQKTRHQRG